MRPLQDENASKIEAGDFHIDLLTRLVTVRGREVAADSQGIRSTQLPGEKPWKGYYPSHLLAAVWGGMSTQQPEYLHVFMNHLRKKLEPEDGSVRYIVTEKWVGYRFEPGEQK